MTARRRALIASQRGRQPGDPMSRRVGEAAFSKVEKCNSELFSLTYGAIVTQLLKDYEEVDATNSQLEKMCGPQHRSATCFFFLTPTAWCARVRCAGATTLACA